MSLDPGRWQQVKTLLGRALELSAEDRVRYLQEADEARDDPELRRLALSYLAAYDSGSLVLGVSGEAGIAALGAAPVDLQEPVGPYRLIRRLGAGGMGEVFLAEQEEPIRRTVALKLIRPDLLGSQMAQVAARFEAERQTLALMSHPNIARIFDAGESADGRLYVAMELIQGTILTESLTEYCDTHELSPHRRLDLFLAVCRGVQHAHQKGVIHRDLKPSNVLVAIEDGLAVPKIIDFGVAKAIREGAPLRPETLLTAQGQWIGTPDYMSPEQAGGSGEEVDTRSDVYSLGVLLYELLTGVQPFDPQELRRAGLAAMLATLREQEPPRMSDRLRDLGARAGSVARSRGLKAVQLEALLRGDLDLIVRKALEKDPDRRYASAAELAADLGRYLRHEPVLASSPGTGAHLRKLVRRHRVGFLAAGLVLLSLLAGIVGTSVGMIRAVRAEHSAREQARQTEAEAAKAREITGFLIDIFNTADPGRSLRPDVTLREVLDQSAERVRTRLAGQPLVQAQVMLVMGKSYHALGQYATARRLFEESVRLRRRELGAFHPDVAESLHNLAWVSIGLGDSARARQLLKETLAIRAKSLGPADVNLASSLNLLGMALRRSGNPERARVSFERALAIYNRQPGGNSIGVAMVLDNLGLLLVEMGRTADARVHLERALRLHEQQLGPHHPSLAFSLNNLAMAVASQGDFRAARSLFTRALEIDRAVYGPDHPNVAIGLLNLGELAGSEGDCRSAAAFGEQGYLILRRHHSADHPTMREASRQLQAARACGSAPEKSE